MAFKHFFLVWIYLLTDRRCSCSYSSDSEAIVASSAAASCLAFAIPSYSSLGSLLDCKLASGPTEASTVELASWASARWYTVAIACCRLDSQSRSPQFLSCSRTPHTDRNHIPFADIIARTSLSSAWSTVESCWLDRPFLRLASKKAAAESVVFALQFWDVVRFGAFSSSLKAELGPPWEFPWQACGDWICSRWKEQIRQCQLPCTCDKFESIEPRRHRQGSPLN